MVKSSQVSEILATLFIYLFFLTPVKMYSWGFPVQEVVLFNKPFCMVNLLLELVPRS